MTRAGRRRGASTALAAACFRTRLTGSVTRLRDVWMAQLGPGRSTAPTRHAGRPARAVVLEPPADRRGRVDREFAIGTAQEGRGRGSSWRAPGVPFGEQLPVSAVAGPGRGLEVRWPTATSSPLTLTRPSRNAGVVATEGCRGRAHDGGDSEATSRPGTAAGPRRRAGRTTAGQARPQARPTRGRRPGRRRAREPVHATASRHGDQLGAEEILHRVRKAPVAAGHSQHHQPARAARSTDHSSPGATSSGSSASARCAPATTLLQQLKKHRGRSGRGAPPTCCHTRLRIVGPPRSRLRPGR